jgi:hypothetical protein
MRAKPRLSAETPRTKRGAENCQAEDSRMPHEPCAQKCTASQGSCKIEMKTGKRGNGSGNSGKTAEQAATDITERPGCSQVHYEASSAPGSRTHRESAAFRGFPVLLENKTGLTVLQWPFSVTKIGGQCRLFF